MLVLRILVLIGLGFLQPRITVILFVLVFGGAWATKQARLTLRVLASYQFHTNPFQRSAIWSEQRAHDLWNDLETHPLQTAWLKDFCRKATQTTALLQGGHECQGSHLQLRHTEKKRAGCRMQSQLHPSIQCLGPRSCSWIHDF